MAVVVGTARGEEPSQGNASGGRVESPSPVAVSPEVARVNGAPFVWPVLDADAYADAGPFREAVAAWRRQGRRPARSLPPAHSPGALYLAADFAYLDAAAGAGDWLAAATAIERALREAPEFPDAARSRFLLGEANLQLGFGPEAGAAFADLLRLNPDSPFAGDARVGQAAALRLRHRDADARRALAPVMAHAHGPLLCRARREDVVEARAAATPADAIAAYRGLVAACPDTLDDPVARAEYAEVLAAAGDVTSARALLAAAPPPGDARLDVVAGRLAADAGDVEGARTAYERVLGKRASDAVVTEAKMRLALLAAAGDPGRATASLLDLAGDSRSPAVRAALLGSAADTAALAGRFEEALALLERAATLGPDGVAQARGRRPEILGRWVAALGDDPGRLGLHASAARLLGLVAERSKSPDLEVTLAEERLAAGDVDGARTSMNRLLATQLPAELVPRARAVAARAAVAAGDLKTASELASGTMDARLWGDVGHALLADGNAAAACDLVAPAVVYAEAPAGALLVAGDAAAAKGGWDAAGEAYGRALRAGKGAERLQAATGLARAAVMRGDRVAARTALASTSGVDDAFVRRAAGAAGRSLALP